jgi:uncharacterized protein (TIGR00106 family)
VAQTIEILEEAGVEYRLGPTSTSVEGDWDPVVSAIGRCHQAAIQNHARVITTITIDDRKDQAHHLDEMVAAVERHLGHATKRIK